MANNLFIDPTNLSTPSSPSGSSCSHEDIDPSHSAGPARKRVRTQDLTSEGRKEARAHRNRIAAQNSRDRRKAHFAYLEQRVAELEEENQRLRAGAGIPPAEPTEPGRARERENEDLKERIRTLERGWDVVLKALAAQGLPNVLESAPTTTDVEPSITKPSSSTVESPSPLPNGTGIAYFPSPAPSHSSLEDPEAKSNPTTLSGPMLSGDASPRTGTKEESSHVSREPTRHLAAGGFTVCASSTLSNNFRSSVHASTPSQAGRNEPTPNTSIPNKGNDDDEDRIMEALFREIVTSPCTAQDATTESRKLSVAGPESAEVMTGCGDEAGSGWHVQLRVMEEKEGEDPTSFVDEITGFHDRERTTEMETERMLDEIIAMTGLVDGGETFHAAEYSDIGVHLGLGVDLGLDLDMSTLSGWDMDAAVGCIEAH